MCCYSFPAYSLAECRPNVVQQLCGRLRLPPIGPLIGRNAQILREQFSNCHALHAVLATDGHATPFPIDVRELLTLCVDCSRYYSGYGSFGEPVVRLRAQAASVRGAGRQCPSRMQEWSHGD